MVLALAGLCGLLLFSYWLAGHRLYQVDECQNIFVARLLATGNAERFFTGVTLFLAPLAWVAHGATHSAHLFTEARLIGLSIFWLNILLLALATQKRLVSRQGLIAVVGAATLAPLWDYGFEIRHDNLLLTGLLLMWCAMRRAPSRAAVYFVVGGLAVVLEFVAFKAFVYSLPISAIGLLALARGSRWYIGKLIAAWMAGGAIAFLFIRLGYGAAGWWELYIRDLRGISQAASTAYIFGPLRTLGRLFVQTPLLSVLAGCAVISSAAQMWRCRRIKRGPDDLLPEVLLLLVTLWALFANPAPFPYNLVNLVPFVFLVAFRYATVLAETISSHRLVLPATCGLVVVGHLLPFCIATYRHVGMTNERQKRLMRAAEELTETTRDRVYDGVGMVPTRDSVDGPWLLHTLNIHTFIEGSGPYVRDLLTRNPAAVIIPNYRTDWLPEEDHAFIRERYVPLSDDFLVLGTVLNAGGGDFRIVHPGRYGVYLVGSSSGESRSDVVRRFSINLLKNSIHLEGTINDKALATGLVELPIGMHTIECPPEHIYAVVWLGPRVSRLPQLDQGDHRRLFVNWY